MAKTVSVCDENLTLQTSMCESFWSKPQHWDDRYQLMSDVCPMEMSG